MTCTHPSYHYYPSLGQKQCTVCKAFFIYRDNQKLTIYKRQSGV